MTISYSSDPDYARQKLIGSWVRLNDSPIFVRDIEESSVYFHNCREERGVADLDSIDLEPIPLGYMNHGRGASFLMRIPARHWRQGLRDQILHAIGPTSGRYSLVSSAFECLVKNIFPTPLSCYETNAEGETVERAFSRDFSVFKPRRDRSVQNLMYKGYQVGKVLYRDKGLEINLDDNKQYLQETLQESLDERYS